MVGMYGFPRVAQAGAATVPGGFNLLPLVVVLGIFYFILIRPQNKRIKEQKALRENLKSGDRVILDCGILGVVKDIVRNRQVVQLEVQPGVVLEVTIDSVYSKGDVFPGEKTLQKADVAQQKTKAVHNKQ